MATDDDIESILSTSDTFCAPPAISYSATVEEISGFVTEHTGSGVPCVITDFPHHQDDAQSPFTHSAEWLESFYRPQESILPCPPEWINWLRESFIVPRCLIPHGSNDMFSDETQNISMRVFGQETESHFQDDSCSTFAHDLLCIGNSDACKYWFMTAAESWPEVTHHLRARDGTNTIRTGSISLQELSEVPFDIYFHKQGKGDLVILPPRTFSQTFQRGVTASLFWDRMTMKGLGIFLYHDRYFKQRTCVRTRYRPQRVLYTFLQGLSEEVVNLKEAQPNDLESLSEKSRTLEQGLRLFDEVINFSYCSCDDELPTIEPLSPHTSCSFCGGELFRTAFCCAGSCVRDDAAGDMVDFKIVLCDLCFVDGRACRCGTMIPYRLQSLEGLINLRTKIADVLDGLIDNRGSGWFHENPQEHGIFYAAKALCESKAREKQPSYHACTRRTAPSHPVLQPWVINCQRCHANRCYQHILSTYNIHSVQALKAHLADTTSVIWHRLHQEMKDVYHNGFTQLKDAVRDGTIYTLAHRLTYYASTFASTTPVSQEVIVGFYDTPGAEVNTTITDAPRLSSGPNTAGRGEVGVRQTRLRRSSSTRSLLANVEASTSRKRDRSPFREEGEVANTSKRRRLADLVEEGETREEGRNEASAPGSEGSPADSSSGEEVDSCTTPRPRPLIREYQKSNRKSHHGDQLSSPLHCPLAHFDPDTDLEVREEPGSSTSGYQSAWEQLLKAHATRGPSTGPAQERTVRHDSALSPTIASSSLETVLPPFEPQHPNQHPNQMSQRPKPNGTPKPHTGHLMAQRANTSRARGLGGGVRQHKVSHLTTSAQSHRLSPHIPALLNQTTPSAISTFSFKAPAREDYPAQRVPHPEPTPRPSGFALNTHAFARSIHPSIHTLGQSSTASVRPRRIIGGNSLSLENMNSYAEIMREAERTLKGIVRQPNDHIPRKDKS